MNFGTGSAATFGTSAYRDEDEVMEDAVTSNLGMISVYHFVFIWSTQLQCVPLGDVILAIDL